MATRSSSRRSTRAASRSSARVRSTANSASKPSSNRAQRAKPRSMRREVVAEEGKGDDDGCSSDGSEEEKKTSNNSTTSSKPSLKKNEAIATAGKIRRSNRQVTVNTAATQSDTTNDSDISSDTSSPSPSPAMESRKHGKNSQTSSEEKKGATDGSSTPSDHKTINHKNSHSSLATVGKANQNNRNTKKQIDKNKKEISSATKKNSTAPPPQSNSNDRKKPAATGKKKLLITHNSQKKRKRNDASSRKSNQAPNRQPPRQGGPTKSQSHGGKRPRPQFPNHSRAGKPQGPFRAWHGGKKDENDRRQLIDKIMKLLYNCKRGERQNNSRKLLSLARRLEAALYKGAKTKAEYILLRKKPERLRVRVRELARESAMKRAILSAATPEAAAAAAASAGASLEEQKRVREQHIRILKQRTRLMLLRHAARCTEADGKCTYTPHCAQVKKLWYHVLECRQNRCQYPHCATSRQVLAHYRQCRDMHCLVCGPVRKAAIRSKEEEREKMRGPCEGYRKPGLLESLKDDELAIHIRECKTENMQTVLGLVLRRLMESKKNRGTFNVPVDVVALNIPHYKDLISSPMDFGTIRKRLETLFYDKPEAFALDVRLVLDNAMKFNPSEHNIHVAARELKAQFEDDLEKALQRLDPARAASIMTKGTPKGGKSSGKNSSKSSRRPQSQAKKALMRGILAPRKNGVCTLCLSETCVQCPMCESGCRAFESPSLHCRGPCGSRVVRNSSFWALPSTNYFIWCQSCYENMHRRKQQIIGGRKVTKEMLIKKKNSDILGEPWVQCDVCNAWQHQICCMYNARAEAKYQDGRFVCPLCRHKIMKEEKEEKEEKLKQERELKEQEENDSSLALAADLLGGSTSDSNNIDVKAKDSVDTNVKKEKGNAKKSVTFKDEVLPSRQEPSSKSSFVNAPVPSSVIQTQTGGLKHNNDIRVDTNIRTPVPLGKSPSSSPLPMPGALATPPPGDVKKEGKPLALPTAVLATPKVVSSTSGSSKVVKKNPAPITIDDNLRFLAVEKKVNGGSGSFAGTIKREANAVSTPMPSGVNQSIKTEIPANSKVPPKTPRSAASTLLMGDRPPGAIELPTCELSKKLQESVDKMLIEDRETEAARRGIPTNEVETAENICIRVVSSIDKEVKVLPRLASRTNYPEKFGYRSKAILMFQRGADDIDICLYAMYVQEYGHDSTDPNKRFSYIAYLDSVNYLKPRRLRTKIYHELLVAYIDSIKKRGFTGVFIWACPPPHKRDDYILHCHPETQRMPSADRLREWYHEMIGKAMKRNIVVESTTLYEEYFEHYHPMRIKRRIALLKKRQQLITNLEKQRLKKLAEEERVKNGKPKKKEKSKPKRPRRPVIPVAPQAILPRQTRSKRKAVEVSESNGNSASSQGGDHAPSALVSLPMGSSSNNAAQQSDKQLPAKTDEEILEELEPNVSRPLPPAMLPYFEGDFWVAEGELALKLFIKDDLKKKQEEAEKKYIDAGGRRARKKRRTNNYLDEKISLATQSDTKNAVASSSSTAAATSTDKTGKPIKNNEKKNLNGGNKKDDIEEEEKFEKLPQDQRDKHHVRLMRRLAVHMEHMKPDFLVCKLKHSCSRCHKYILNETRYRCAQCESVGHPFNLCESCHEIESAKTGLNKTLHQVHADRIREEAAYHLGGGGSSGVKRVLSISQEGLNKGNLKVAEKEIPEKGKNEKSGDEEGNDAPAANNNEKGSAESPRRSSRRAGTTTKSSSSRGEDVADKRSKQKESAADGSKAKVVDAASSLPKAVPSSKKAAIVDKVKANEQRRSKALALKRANYERLIEAMAWDEKHVLTTCEESTVKDTTDSDPKVDCPILNTRLALLGVCQGNRYQFDQKRRAKHSTMMLLYHLHNPKAPLYVHTCNECQQDILGDCRFNCSVCPDFDLCARCYRHVNHIHRLKRIPVDVSGTADEKSDKEDRKKRSLALFLESLVHATSCKGCSRPECRKMKELLAHRNVCKVRASGGCDTCQRILCLLQIHAKQCKDDSCKVLYCKVLKRRIQASKERKKLETKSMNNGK